MKARRQNDGSTNVLAFAWIVWKYWTNIYPRIRHERLKWQADARRIPDTGLRDLALQAHAKKWGDIEGAGAFATFVPLEHQDITVRALVAFQTAYDYADNVSEQPACDQRANSRQLHTALRLALGSGSSHKDYYSQNPEQCDNGYLERLVDATRGALTSLPSYTLIASYVRQGADRIAHYQGLNHAKDTHEELARWGSMQTPAGHGLRWWEVCAASGSSLDILALIAAAADSTLIDSGASALLDAYYPWVCAFHTLLDSLIDYRLEHAMGQYSLVDPYDGPTELATGMQRLAKEALGRLDHLPRAYQHRLLFTAMCCLYISDCEASAPHALIARSRIFQTLNWTAIPILWILALRRLLRNDD